MKGGSNLKKLLMLVSLFLICFAAGAHAEMIVDVEVGSKKLALNLPPFISDGSVYVPLRAVSDALGIECDWSEKDKSAYSESENAAVIFYPYRSYAKINGKKEPVTMYLNNGSLMVPVRFLSECHGFSVNWDNTFYRVMIEGETSVPESLIDRTYNQDEVYWLSKIIHSESVGEVMEGQIAVGNVILNRVESKDFPNTIYSVIFDRAGGVQFEPVINGSIYASPSHSSVEAAKRALSGENTAGNSLFFLNPKKAQSFWIVNTRSFYRTIGNHDFYL